MKIYYTPSTSPDDRSKPSPWGLRATLGFSALIVLANLASGVMAAVGFVAFTQNPYLEKDPSQLAFNGTLVTLSILISAPVILGLTLIFANLRRGLALKDYLGLHEVDWKQVVKWLLVLFFFAGASDLITLLLKRPVVEQFMFNIYSTATSKPLLWTALVIAAPVSEEIFFRGFLFYGILNTGLGPTGAVVLSSLIWAPLHIQYDLYGLATVLVLGLLFGYARLKTNSVYIPIAMHALMNFIAAMEVMIHITRTSPVP
ncbi:MAG: type II CAAX endopeptidase family protein [Deltaproteobacteria bacterium]